MASTHQADWSPEDWPESLHEMRVIDNLLRCSICYEYFNTAVLFQECSHNYCSLCVRQAMVFAPQCPTCFEKTSGNDIKCNRVLDELVKNFINVRSKLLDLIKKALVQSVPEKKEIEMSDDSASNFENTPRRMRLHSKTKKGKSPCITPRNKRKRQKLVSSGSNDDDSVEDKQPQAMEVDPGDSTPRTSQPTDRTSTNSSFVECPVCEEFISSNTINSHLDLCLITGDKKTSLRSHKKATETKPKTEPDNSTASVSSVGASSYRKSPPRKASTSSSQSHKKSTNKKTGSNALISAGPKRKPIPGIVYAILSDKKLKQKLKEWNLSTQGDRKTLIKRHQEFVVAYNAECDSVNPKSAAAIVKELEIREKRKNTKLLKPTSTVPNLHLNKDASEEEVEVANKQYLQQNKGQFQKLVDEIRNRKQRPATSDDKPTKSVIVINDSKEDDVDRQASTDQDQSQVDDRLDKNAGMGEPNVSELDSPLRTSTSKKHSIPCESSSSDVHLPKRTDYIKQHEQQVEKDDCRNQNIKDKKEFVGTNMKSNVKDKKKVPEPPMEFDLASIDESDSTHDDDSDDKNDADADDDDDGTNGDDKSKTDKNDEDDDDTNDDDIDDKNDDDDTNENDDDDDDETDDSEEEDNNKGDKDWELTPSFGIASSEEEYNEVQYGESDEDLFAPTPRTKMRSLRRKKK